MEFLQYVNNKWAGGIAGFFILYLILRKTKVLDTFFSGNKELVEHLKKENADQKAEIAELNKQLRVMLFEKNGKSRGSKHRPLDNSSF